MKGKSPIIAITLALLLSLNGCNDRKTSLPSSTNSTTATKSTDTAGFDKTSTSTNSTASGETSTTGEVSVPSIKPSPDGTSKYFPDPVLAETVAQALNKTLADSVTKEELAGYTGALDCPPGELSDLTGIGYMTGLTSLSCSKNNVTKIPSEIKNLVNLETLDFGKAYSVESIPKEIGSLEKLKYMRFYLTSITTIPKELCNLQNLKFLILGANQIQSVPEELGNLSKLQYLDIHDNQLTTIPDSICSLTDLRELDLSHNSLTALPSNFGRLVKLKTLNLFNNKIRILPKSMENMLNLDTLNVYDNYELSESYKSFMPKMQSSRTDILSGSDCILTLPPGLDPNNEKITFEFKNDDTAFDVYYDYTKIKPSAPEPGKITLRKGLFTGSGPYVFRITVKKPGESPAYDIYLWHINVQ